MLKRMIVLIVVSLVIIILAFSIFKNKNQQVSRDEATHFTERLKPIPSFKSDADTTNIGESKDLKEEVKKCYSRKQEIDKSRKYWRANIFPSGDNLLEQGYSIDEVTLAIEYFRRGNWSYVWRTNHFKKESSSSKKNKDLREYAQLLIGQILPDNIDIRHKYPQAFFEGYQSKSQSERIKLLKENSPTVDDLAAFIKAGSLDEEDLRVILTFIDSPDDLLGVDSSRVMSLLDYAARAGYSKLLSDLIKLGVPMTEDWYISSTLEQSLVGLSYALNSNKELNSRVGIVKMLMEQGGKAEFEIIGKEEIQRFSGGVFVEFSRKDISRLLNDYGLDLLSITQKESPDKAVLRQNIVDHFVTEEQKYLNSQITGFSEFDRSCSKYKFKMKAKKAAESTQKLKASGFCVDSDNRIVKCKE